MTMFNLGYKKWLVAYVEGSLDNRRRAMLESRIKADAGLAAEVEMLRRMTVRLRESALTEPASPDDGNYLLGRRSIWPRVESAIQVRRPVAGYSPRFALAGTGIAAAVVFGAVATLSPNRQAPRMAAVSSVTAPAIVAPFEALPPTAPAVKPSAPKAVDKSLSANGYRPSWSPPIRESHSGRDASQPELSLASVGSTRLHPALVGAMIGTGVRGTVSKPSMESRLSSPSVDDGTPTPPAESAPPAPPITVRMADTRSGPDAGQDVVGFNPGARVMTPFDNVATMSSPFIADGDGPRPPMMAGASGGGHFVVNPGIAGPHAVMAVSQPKSIDALRQEALDVEKQRKAALQNLDANRSLTADQRLEATEQLSDLYANTAIVAWRDALEFSVVAPIQNADTSEQVADTLNLVRSAGFLTNLSAMMQDECNLRPNEIAGWRILGHLYALTGDAGRAANAWLHAVKTSDVSGEDWYQLGRADEANGDKAGAILAYQQVDGPRKQSAVDRLTALGK